MFGDLIQIRLLNQMARKTIAITLKRFERSYRIRYFRLDLLRIAFVHQRIQSMNISLFCMKAKMLAACSKFVSIVKALLYLRIFSNEIVSIIKNSLAKSKNYFLIFLFLSSTLNKESQLT